MDLPPNRGGFPGVVVLIANGARDQTDMSQISKAIFGAAAVSLVLGAVPLAFGQDLADRWQAVTDTPAAADSVVNRSAKADRGTVVAAAAAQTRTIAVRLDGLADTSVLVRIPLAKPAEKDARNAPAAAPARPGNRKTVVACEPPVSVLTDVAKLLQPGRCVT